MKTWLGLVALALPLAACGNNASPDTSTSTSTSTSVPIVASSPPPLATAPGAASAASAAPKPAGPASSAKVDTHGIPVGVPFPPDAIVKALDPKGVAPYAGPTGTLRGTVHVAGDAPPTVPGLKIKPQCGEAQATYGKLFRVGLEKTLADVLVAVTGYDGFVPAASDTMKMTIHGCAMARRTIAATYGQRLELSNLDPLESFMPYLDGAPTESILVAVPGGPPIKLYPHQPGHYLIRDQLPNPFFTADVFVLAYATHDVTGLDGKYEITGIPVGKVKVNAFLPALGAKAPEEQLLEIKPGENKADLTIKFDLKTDMPGVTAAASAAAAAATPPKPAK
jgi:hypothetical protein